MKIKADASNSYYGHTINKNAGISIQIQSNLQIFCDTKLETIININYNRAK